MLFQPLVCLLHHSTRLIKPRISLLLSTISRNFTGLVVELESRIACVMPRRRNVGTRAKASSGPQPSELTDPEPVPPCTVAPFPRDSARCVWALEGFRQRMFSCLSRADQVRAMTISKESYPQAVRARFHELDVWIYEDELPTITHPVSRGSTSEMVDGPRSVSHVEADADQ
jgi:hypothetical protein